MQKAHVWGLTGGIACGKSTVSEWFVKAGIPVVDADMIARDVVLPGSVGLKQLVDQLGAHILDPRGLLDRARLAALLFSDPLKQKQIEGILHPLIRKNSQEKIEQLMKQGYKNIIYSAALIFENHLETQLDGVLLLACSPKTQIERLLKREGMNQREAFKRIQAQMPMSQKIQKTPYVIYNDGPLEETQKQLHDKWHLLTGECILISLKKTCAFNS